MHVADERPVCELSHDRPACSDLTETARVAPGVLHARLRPFRQSVDLSDASKGYLRQAFLGHGETQGEVLEGFVLLAIDASSDLFAPLLAKYDDAVAPHRAAALAVALRLGDECRARDKHLLLKLQTAWPREPRRVSMSQAKWWRMACSGSGSATSGELETEELEEDDEHEGLEGAETRMGGDLSSAQGHCVCLGAQRPHVPQAVDHAGTRGGRAER